MATRGVRARSEAAPQARRGFARTSAALAVVVLVSLAGPTGALAGTGSAGSNGPLCAQPVLDDPAGGTEAIRELGTDLAAAAKGIDKSPAEFRTLLREDASVQVDECGATFVVEPEASPPSTAGTGGDPVDGSTDLTPAAGGLDSTGDAFALSSRPGSARTIYLDFTGERIVGTAWNTSAGVADFTATPYDLDGAPGSFSAAESNIVRGVWLRVAEDFAPFDVNVTTADPGAAAITRSNNSDQVYGTRALITPDQAAHEYMCDQQCGGVAYVGTFDNDYSHARYQPAWIFSRALQPTAKSIAEAVSHEVGHNLGLSHDGSSSAGYDPGHSPWAPIMGVGYYQPVSQWSNGEYGGNNAENDLAVIANNGATIAADDFPNSLGAAAPLSANTAVHGVIATRADVDAFTFTVPAGAETTTVMANPASVGADLDIRLSLYDEAGNLVATADPPPVRTNAEAASGLDARLAQPLAPGTYVATVDGTGWSTATAGYTDYASLGHYTISVSGFTDPLVVTSGGIPSAVAGSAYSTTLAASGGTAPYAWSSTSAPAWLRLSADGVLSGTPPSRGTYVVTAQVADAVDTVATRAVTLVVGPAPVAPATEVAGPPDVLAVPVITTTMTTRPATAMATRPTVLHASLGSAVAGLTVHSEQGAGFSMSRFPVVDTNRDCRSTRVEVLLAESLHRPQFTRPGCQVRSGQWFSSFDRRTVTSGQKVTAAYAVPLAEAWSSGARSWPAAKRRAYANDLGDRRTLLAVSTASARARGTKEPTTWLPAPASRCSYVASWVAVKVRWGLTVDAAEKRRLVSLAASCPKVTLTVHRV